MGMFTILSVEAVTEVSKVLTLYIFNNPKKLTGFLQIQMYDLEKDKITRRFRNLSSILVRESYFGYVGTSSVFLIFYYTKNRGNPTDPFLAMSTPHKNFKITQGKRFFFSILAIIRNIIMAHNFNVIL